MSTQRTVSQRRKRTYANGTPTKVMVYSTNPRFQYILNQLRMPLILAN